VALEVLTPSTLVMAAALYQWRGVGAKPSKAPAAAGAPAQAANALPAQETTDGAGGFSALN